MIAEKPEVETIMGCVHGDCPLHAENPPFNTKVLAAIAEGNAIFKGDLPANYNFLRYLFV